MWMLGRSWYVLMWTPQLTPWQQPELRCGCKAPRDNVNGLETTVKTGCVRKCGFGPNSLPVRGVFLPTAQLNGEEVAKNK